MIPILSANTADDRGYPWIAITGPITPPDPTVPWNKKDKDYDNRMARYHASKVNNTYVDWFRIQYGVNSRFARGAWGVDEDRITFLKDGMKDTTRKEMSIPIVQPFVLRLCGQAASLGISAKAIAITPYATTKKETAMNKAVAYALAAQQGDYAKKMIEATTGFGPDEFQNKVYAEKTYVDKRAQVANMVMTMQEVQNDYTQMRNTWATSVACSGFFGAHCIREGMELNWYPIHPYDFAWDTNTNRGDLCGEYMIHAPFVSIPALARRYSADKELVKRIYQYGTMQGGGARNNWPQGQPRIQTVYWRDPQFTKVGYVLEGDRPKLVVLDEPDSYGNVKYTESMCIDPPVSSDTADWKGKTKSTFIEVIRYCTYLPFEYTPAAREGIETWSEENPKIQDLVLEHGVCDLQNVDPERPGRVGFPIIASTVQYLDGFIIAPITAAIAPQRVANQVVSDLVWRMSKAGNNSTVFDSRALAGSRMSMEDINYAQKEGNAYELDGSMAGGLNNAVRNSDTSLPQSFYQMWSVPTMITQIAQNGVGIQDATLGQSQGQKQLVGTTQLLLQQSNTMMQPFMQCWTLAFKQIHQFDAQAGTKFFARNPWMLAEKVGDQGVQAVLQDPTFNLEQFRVAIEPSIDAAGMKAATDEMIKQFYQLQIFDGTTASNLGGRSFGPDDVWAGARTYWAAKQEAATEQAMQQQKANQAAVLSQQAQALTDRQDQTYADAVRLFGQQMGAEQKAYQPFAQRAAEATIPVPSESTGTPAAGTPGT